MHTTKRLPFIGPATRKMNRDIVPVGEQLYPANDVHLTFNTLSKHMIGQVQKIH